MIELSPEEEALYRSLLTRHLAFYDSLRLQGRRPRTAAQRRFQDVAWGCADPISDHERTYCWHLRRREAGPFAPAPPQIDERLADHPAGLRPVSADVASKWDNAWREERDGIERW